MPAVAAERVTFLRRSRRSRFRLGSDFTNCGELSGALAKLLALPCFNVASAGSVESQSPNNLERSRQIHRRCVATTGQTVNSLL